MALHLVQTPLAPDLQAAGEDIADGIRSGLIVGLGVIVLLKGRRFFVDAFGTLPSDPHAGRGYVAELDDCLREIGHRKRDTNTTR